MKKIILVILFAITLFLMVRENAQAQPTPQEQMDEQKKDYFCNSMAGMAIVMTQFKDQGITKIRAVSEFQEFLKTHPEYDKAEGEYAISVIETLYKFPNLRGETLGKYIYDQCFFAENTI